MQHMRIDESPILAVRAAVARHLHVPITAVRPDHELDCDLGIDVLDRAYVAIELEDLIGVDVAVPSLDPDATVADLARAWTPLFARLERERRRRSA